MEIEAEAADGASGIKIHGLNIKFAVFFLIRDSNFEKLGIGY